MIEVEITGVLSAKEYERIKNILSTGGEKKFDERQTTIIFSDTGYNFREVTLTKKNEIPKIYINSGKVGERKEKMIELAKGTFSDALKFLAELGYKKGVILEEDVFSCKFAGAQFSLFDPGEESFHYEAIMTAKDDASVKEARARLDEIARKFKLPIWNPKMMMAFYEKLNEKIRKEYSFEISE